MLTTKQPVNRANNQGWKQFWNDQVKVFLEIQWYTADLRRKTNLNIDHGCDQGTNHEDTHQGSSVSQSSQSMRHCCDQRNPFVISNSQLLPTKYHDGNLSSDPDEDPNWVALRCHLCSNRPENSWNQGSKDGITDSSEGPHQTGFNPGNSFFASNPFFFFDRQINPSDDGIEEV